MCGCVGVSGWVGGSEWVVDSYRRVSKGYLMDIERV